jgi:hypothetical protein
MYYCIVQQDLRDCSLALAASPIRSAENPSAAVSLLVFARQLMRTKSRGCGLVEYIFTRYTLHRLRDVARP